MSKRATSLKGRLAQSRLGRMLFLWRTVQGRTLRDVAREIGIGHATLMRIEHGEQFDAATMLKLWHWLLGTTPDTAEARES